MLETVIDVFGWIGAATAILIFIPQVVKLIRSRDATSLSPFTFSLNIVGTATLTIFSAMTAVWQGLACNAFITILLLVVFHHIYLKQRRYFYMWVGFVAATLVASIVVAVVVDANDTPIAARYVFILVSSIALAVCFIPQIRNVFIHRHYRSYSFTTSMLITGNNLLWLVYWIGLAVLAGQAEGSANELLPLFTIAAISTVFRIFLQLSAAPFYFISRKQDAKALRTGPKG